MSALDDLIDMVEELEMEVQPARDELRQLRAELEGAKNGKQHADDEMKSLAKKLKQAEAENACLCEALSRYADKDNWDGLDKAGSDDLLVWIPKGEKSEGPDIAAAVLDVKSETCWANHYARRAQEFRDAVGPLLAYRDANTLNFQLEKLDDFLRELRQLMEKQP